MKSGISVVFDGVKKMQKALAAITEAKVMVGIPAKNAERDEEEDNDKPINNAAIGYIQEKGAPEHNLPARPFLVPGVRNAQPTTIALFREGSVKALSGETGAVKQSMEAAGLNAASQVRKVITDVIPPPLSWATIQGRLDKLATHKDKNIRKLAAAFGPSQYMDYAAGKDVGLEFTPLVDTGQLLASITYVIRKK